jgi:hypothetical protein
LSLVGGEATPAVVPADNFRRAMNGHPTKAAREELAVIAGQPN